MKPKILSKKGKFEAFIHKLKERAKGKNSNLFEISELESIALDLNIDNVSEFLMRLNEGGFLLKKTARTFSFNK